MESVEMVAADTTSGHSPHTVTASATHPHSHTYQSDEPRPKHPKFDHDSPPKQRPIGIAQPFRQLSQDDGTAKGSVVKLHQQQVLRDTPECSDSEESTTGPNRYDWFATESKSQEGGVFEEEDDGKKSSEARPDKPLAISQSAPPHGSTGLPWGKKWLVFVSHSTADQLWVRQEIVVQLRQLKIPVTASYHYMPDSSRYDDRAIRQALNESCMAIIALSPAYTSSRRCNTEWQASVKLCSNGRLDVVVASVHQVPRPKPLKQFLHLDFMDPKKRVNVWNKLMERIDSCITPTGDKEQNDMQLHTRPPSAQLHTLTDHPHHSHSDRTAHTHLTTKDSLVQHQHHTDHTPNDHAPSRSTDYSPPSLTEDHTQSELKQIYQTTKQSIESSGGLSDHMTLEIPGKYFQGANMDNTTDDVTEDTGRVIQDNNKQPDDNIISEGKGQGEDVEEGEVSSDEMSNHEQDQASKVTNFYNQLAQPDADRRQESPIFFMRNFNNWVKSVLIRSYVKQRSAVLDLCCGKGGDLLKWKEGRISYLVCADISDVSVQAAEGRYNSPKMRLRGGDKPFEAEFICADCCQVRLRDCYSSPWQRFRITSCQFSVHYSFESYEKAHMMLRNACENLLPGGYFIGTTVDANQLLYRLREAGQTEDGLWTFGNEVFTVTLDPGLDPRDTLPLFGAKYNFQLHKVVDLPEYLVHFPTFQCMLKEFDMEFEQRQNFIDFFKERRNRPEDADLLYKMSAFDKRTGTMSAAEWEAIGLYMVFVFRKRSLSGDYD